jgi:hypothetical protein
MTTFPRCTGKTLEGLEEMARRRGTTAEELLSAGVNWGAVDASLDLEQKRKDDWLGRWIDRRKR